MTKSKCITPPTDNNSTEDENMTTSTTLDANEIARQVAEQTAQQILRFYRARL